MEDVNFDPFEGEGLSLYYICLKNLHQNQGSQLTLGIGGLQYAFTEKNGHDYQIFTVF